MSIGYYASQSRKARELAVKELGAEKAAFMSDGEITEWIDSNYAIFWGDCDSDGLGSHKHDEETVALIPNDVYYRIEDSIVWLTR